MAKLVCMSGLNKDDEFPIGEGVNVIGRSTECNITIFDKKCSRKHCQIFKKGNYYAVEDCQSRHGTYLGGKKIDKRITLDFGDKIKIGQTTLVLSDKPLGDLVDQTADEAAADLTDRGFNKLLDSAAADVLRKGQQKKSHEEVKPKGGVLGIFRSIFAKKR